MDTKTLGKGILIGLIIVNIIILIFFLMIVYGLSVGFTGKLDYGAVFRVFLVMSIVFGIQAGVWFLIFGQSVFNNPETNIQTTQ